MSRTRREFAALLPALAAAQTAKPPKPVLGSKVYVYEELPVKANGENRQRAVLDGLTHTKYPVEMHLTELAPGAAPHAPHRHAHEEMVMVRRGVLEVTIEGKATKATPGSVVYVASNEMHGSRNVGEDRAEYFVITLGREG